MSKFYFDADEMIRACWHTYLPTETQILDTVRENNKTFSYWFDSFSDRVYFQCENKPRNLPLFGIEWKEVI